MANLHVYAKARLFVIVPVCAGVECAPVERVELIVGRDSVGMLAAAMQEALSRCADTVTPWIEERDTWHTYHLMQVGITWADNGSITAVDEDGTRVEFATRQERQVAEWLIKRVGVRLL